MAYRIIFEYTDNSGERCESSLHGPSLVEASDKVMDFCKKFNFTDVEFTDAINLSKVGAY
jgi:hypothetical protein